MGSAKRFMMEQEEIEAHGALIEFTCPIDGCNFEVSEYVNVPDINITAEKQSDISQSDMTEVICGNCDKTFEATITNDGATLESYLNDHPDVHVETEPPSWFDRPDDDYDYWYYETADDPVSIYYEACRELDDFIQSQCVDTFVSLQNRMAFTQAWSIFETYLADQLATHLMNDRNALIRFSRGDEAVKNLKFDASNMIENNLTVEAEVIRSIKSRLYHQFDKKGVKCRKSKGVPKWFQIGLQVEIESDVVNLDRLRYFASLRHDCVHRNGKNHKGQLCEDIQKRSVLELRALMNNIVENIANKLTENYSADFF